MTLDEFSALIATHGSDESRWPAVDGARMRTLLAGSEAARALLQREAALDRLLAAAPAPLAPVELKMRVMAGLDKVPSPLVGVSAVITPFPRVAPLPEPVRKGALVPRLSAMFGAFWPQAIGFAAASLLGFAIGLSNPAFLTMDERTDLSGYIIGYDSDAPVIAFDEGLAQ